MARNVAQNLDHLLIRTSPEDTIPGFELDGVAYKITKKVPASAIIALTTSTSNAQGMLGYILHCIPDPDQKVSFEALKDLLDVEGFGAVIEEIVEKTTPFDGTKPSA